MILDNTNLLLFYKLYHNKSYYNQVRLYAIRYHLYNFKKRQKHKWSSVTFSKSVGKVTLLHDNFSRFLNCANDTELLKASQLLILASANKRNDRSTFTSRFNILGNTNKISVTSLFNRSQTPTKPGHVYRKMILSNEKTK